MLIVETIAKIRRAFFVQGKPIKAICRELRVSRKVVRKVIRSETTEFRYEREAQPLPQIGPWRDKLDQLLLTNEGKAARERLTLIRLFEELRGIGYGGGYDAVRRYARQWSKERGASTVAAYVPLLFGPGEAYQFDWSHEVVLLSGVTVIVKAAHVRLCHSRMPFVRVYPRETQEMVFDAHERAFALFKGACQRGIYDNMKTAVETIAKLRRAYFVRGQPIKAICRDLCVSRKVVRKVIRSKATEFRYEREAQPHPKIGPWSDKLDQLLVANEGKAPRDRLTLIRLFEELRGWGYAGGYDAVRRYARRWRKERGATTAAAYVPLSFAPGEAYQFDWSHEVC